MAFKRKVVVVDIAGMLMQAAIADAADFCRHRGVADGVTYCLLQQGVPAQLRLTLYREAMWALINVMPPARRYLLVPAQPPPSHPQLALKAAGMSSLRLADYMAWQQMQHQNTRLRQSLQRRLDGWR